MKDKIRWLRISYWAGAIGDVFGRCCLDPAQEPFYSPVIQERAWTSPIWINPTQ